MLEYRNNPRKTMNGLYGLYRRYWDDARHSSLDHVSKLTCARSAAARLGVPEAALLRWYDACIADPPCYAPY